jgi:hypothetical protein
VSTVAVAAEQPGRDRARIATLASYTVLAVVLVASRAVGLGHSFWTDEITAVEDFIRAGPREILTGPDLSHELFGLLAWLTSSLVGESEVALRLLSVVPFLAGVALVTAWLHANAARLAGVVFLFLATVSPLLLDITRQARGYGLAFLAMSVLVLAALDAIQSGRTVALVAFCAGGLAGTATLPQFGIAFVVTGVVLLTVSELRRRTAVGLAISLLALAAFYAPHLGQVRDAAQIEDGVRIDTLWLLTAPIDQVLLPALIWIDGTALVAGVVWLPAVLLALFVMAFSPLARERTTALLLCSGPVATVVVLWLAQAYVIPRYLSYLLVPLFVLLATGVSALLTRNTTRATAVASAICVVVVVSLAIRFATLAPDVVRLPREANRDAAETVLATEPPPVVVLAYMRNPRNLEHYLDRGAVRLDADSVDSRVCGSERPVAYVTQPFGIAAVEPSCLGRSGVEHRRFEQYARGEMNVWFVPPS